MPFLRKTAVDRRHCWVVVSSNEINERWCRGNDDVVTSSGAVGADPRDKAASDWPAERDEIVNFRGSLTTV
jgi:hypothetical protein